MKVYVPYTKDFFVFYKSESYHSAQQLVPLVQQFVPVRSVCDIGCGVGTWLRAFREAGIEDIAGFDGSYVDKSLLEISGSAFHEADLRQPLRWNRSFDLAISLEVAEHLPESGSVSFVEDLTRLSPVVLFSAAIPHQSGTDHINEQWPTYWAAIFAQHDFATCDVLRPLIWDNAGIARWYRQNIFLFCRRDLLPDLPGLTVSHKNAMPLSVVHPETLLAIFTQINVRGSFQLFAEALQRAVHRRVNKFLRDLRTSIGKSHVAKN